MTIADTVGARRHGDRTIAVLTWLFFLSGAAGLIYESIWARYLGLFVGHDAYGQITVLIIFLGGMSLGAALVSRFTTRLKSPLLGYALVELLVGGIGFWFHDLYLGVTEHTYLALYPAVAGSWTLSAVKWSIAGGLILPQSVLLGATFPLMTAGAIRLSRLPRAGSSVSCTSRTAWARRSGFSRPASIWLAGWGCRGPFTSPPC